MLAAPCAARSRRSTFEHQFPERPTDPQQKMWVTGSSSRPTSCVVSFQICVNCAYTLPPSGHRVSEQGCPAQRRLLIRTARVQGSCSAGGLRG